MDLALAMASAEKWASGFPMFLCIIIPNQRKQCVYGAVLMMSESIINGSELAHITMSTPPIPEYTWSYGKVMPKVEVNL